MKVTCHYRNDSEREMNDPLPEKAWSFVFRLYSGDICSPMLRMLRKENWFNPPYPSKVWRKLVKWPVLPFFAWRFKRKGGYVGFKCYGADPVVYKEWMPEVDVYPGSQALTLSFRPFASVM